MAHEALGRVADVGLKRPRGLLVVAVVLAALLGIYATGTEINTSRHTMVAADNPHQAKQMRYFERFGLPSAMVLVVSGGSDEARRKAVDALADRLQQKPWLAGRTIGRLTAKDFAKLALLHDPALVQKLAQGVFEPPVPPDDGYLLTSDKAHHLLVLLADLPGDQGHEVKPFVDEIRATVDETLASLDGPAAQVTARLTGPPALSVDEQKEIERGIITTSGLTALGILLLLYLAFRSVRYTLLALVPIAIGVCATMAVARLIYGELNMVTSSCSSILLALGIDFGVFLLSRYGEFVRGGADAAEAIRGAIKRAGAGLLVGAITTATAFLTTSATEFTAYARLGVIVAVGLLLMMASTLLLMPALLWVVGRGKQLEAPEIKLLRVLPNWIRRGRHGLALGSLALLVASLMSVSSLRFNTRFYDFLPDEGDSAAALRIIEHDDKVSPLHATVPASNIEQARDIAKRLRARDEVAAVQTPSDLLPPLDEQRMAALKALRSAPVDLNTLAAMIPPAQRAQLALLEEAMVTAGRVADRGSYAPEDLPDIFRRRFASLNGDEVSLTVTGSGDIWDPPTARAFSSAVSEVAPEATGMAMHIHAHLEMIREGFTRAALAAAVLVLLILVASFRNLVDALLAMVPTVVGFSWMLGAMALLRFNFDAANIVTLPLIIGIGVDAGVHLVHRMRQSRADRGGRASLEEITVGTGGAVALASVTTTVGFASLMLAEYGAMKSLGLAMTLGISATLLASLLLLPSLMVLMGRAE